MSDTQRMDLIEHYEWTVSFCAGSCVIMLHAAKAYVVASTFREAFDKAFKKQAEWAMS